MTAGGDAVADIARALVFGGLAALRSRAREPWELTGDRRRLWRGDGVLNPASDALVPQPLPPDALRRPTRLIS